MNSTGNRIILLLVVGLTAFSSALKELNQIQQLSLDASRLVAQWSGTIVPAEVPQTPAPAVVKVESCEMNQSVPSVELPWLTQVAEVETSEIETPVVVKRSKSSKVEVIKRVRRLEVDPVQFEVRIPFNHNADADSDETIVSDFPVTTFTATPFKAAKARKHNSIRFSIRDREMLLKTLNRSINLRIAS